MKLKKMIAGVCSALLLMAVVPSVNAYSTADTGLASSIVKSDGEDISAVDIPDGYIVLDNIDGNNLPSDFSYRKKALYSTGANDTMDWSLEDGVLKIMGNGSTDLFKTEEDTYPWIENSNAIKKIVISDGVTEIGRSCFAELSGLKDVELADSVKSIGEAAFYNCYNLSKINLPSGLEVISKGTFANCYSLNIDSEINAETIDDYAFQSTKIQNVKLGANVRTLSGIAFFNCQIKNFTIDSENEVYTSVDGTLYSKDMSTLIQYPSAAPKTRFTVPEGTVKIGEQAFINSKQLTEIILPSTVTTLGSSAFQGCDGLTKFIIPDSITEAGYFTFAKCNRLKKITFGTGLKTTPYQMFIQCGALKEVDFGGLTEIGDHCFRESGLEKIVIPETITSMGGSPFVYCYKLKEVETKALKEMPGCAFFKCENLEKITLNEGLETIESRAFFGCLSLKEIDIPETVSFINTDAFDKATTLNLHNKKLKPYGENGYRYLETVNVSGTKNYANAFKVLEIVNTERSKEGLAPLVMNSSLMESAMHRAAEATALFSHTRTDGSICFDLNSLMKAENIAFGQGSPESAMQSWMNSTGHRRNILTESFTTIGIGNFQIDGANYWVQCFGEGNDTSSCDAPENKQVSEEINLCIDKFLDGEARNSVISFTEPNEYYYEFIVKARSESLMIGENTAAEIFVKNCQTGGFTRVTSGNVVWTTENGLVNVDELGVITALKGGNETIKAQLEYYSASMKLNIKKFTPVLNYTKSFVKNEDDEPFVIDLSVENGEAPSYSSSDDSVVNVSEDGKVTIKGAGSCVITAEVPETDTTYGAKATITITVNPKETETVPTETETTTEPKETESVPTETETTTEPKETESVPTETETTTEPSETQTVPTETETITEPSETQTVPTETETTTKPSETQTVPTETETTTEPKETESVPTETETTTEPKETETVPTETETTTQLTETETTEPTQPEPKSIDDCTVSGIKSKTYNGKTQTLNIAVADGDTKLEMDTDYTVAYKNNKKAGTATVIISGKGSYTGEITKTFKIAKAKNTMTVKANKKSVKLNDVKKKKMTVKKAITVKKNKGAVSYKIVKKGTSKGLSISKKGVVTIKKGAAVKKTTLKIVVKVTAKGNKNYKKLTKKITVKIKVK